MNKKFVYSIALGSTLAVLPTFADNDVAELRSQLESVTKRLEELESKPAPAAQSSWADKVKIKGDLRYRFEHVEEDGSTSKNRQRIRARLGAYAEVNDFTTAGIRIRTGEEANSGNQTIGDNFNSKEIFFDLAYMTLAPEDAKYGAVTLGKMKYPWKVTTDMIWDSDVNPEGLAYTYATKIEDTGLFGSIGGFKVADENSTHDQNLGSAQAGITQPLCEKSKLTAGGSFFAYNNATNLSTTVDYRIAEAFAELSFKDVLPVGFKLYGNYVNNIEESSADDGFCFGIKFGDAKKGKWEAKLGYRDLDVNAAPADFADSDYAGGGTGIKGARLKAKYNLCKNLQAGLTYISGEDKTSDNDVNTLHLDLVAQF